MKTLTTTILIFIVSNLFAQTVNKSTIAILNQELTETGISQVIKFKDVIIDEENDIIRVQFWFTNQDAALNDTLWRMLKSDFKEQKNQDIRKYLYFYSINVFKLPNPKNVLLEIRQSYINEDCPFIQFYFNEDTNAFTGDEKEKICMAEWPSEILLNSFIYFDKDFILEKDEIAIEVYYRRIDQHFKTLYEKDGGFEGNSKNAKFTSKYKTGDKILKFEVSNLEKEVLYDSGENFVYQILELIYGEEENFVPCESLKFEITLTTKKATNQMSLNVKILGRYGSGFYKTCNWNKMNDMDNGFPQYMDDYIKNKVTEKIIYILTNLK